MPDETQKPSIWDIIRNGGSSAVSLIQTLTGTRDISGISRNPGLDQTSYSFNYSVFPEDLGSDHSNHYMVININVPVNASSDRRGNYYGRVRGEGGDFVSTILNNNFSKVDNLRFNPATSPVSGGTGDFTELRELYTPQRSTRRIAESIALYMPSPMVYVGQNLYEDVSLTSILGQAGKLAVGAVSQRIGEAAGAFFTRRIQAARQAGGAGGNLIDAYGNVVGTAFALAGNPINPRIEVLFSTTVQRQFVFEFMLAPRNQNESKTIKNIIKTLRFHAAPEVDSSLGLIPTFIPPAEFDITFYKGGAENMNIPRINTCVLERVEVDYAPSGAWATFSNGHPVAVRLSLAFREIEIIHKRRVVQGF